MSKLNDLCHGMESELADAHNRITKAYAKRFLVELRAMLAPFNLSRHNVTISSGNGSACLCINGRVWSPEWEGPTQHRMAPA